MWLKLNGQSSRAKKVSRVEEDSDDPVVEETAGPSPEPEPEVDPKTFAQCRKMMGPVMKKIIDLGDDIHPGKSSEVQVSPIMF